MNLRKGISTLAGIVICSAASAAFAMSDGGVDAVVTAQQDSQPIDVELADVQAMLSDWVYSKGWSEGWDTKKNRMIMVGEVSGRIRPTDRDFLTKRAALYQELELRLKARIIETFLTEVSASVVIDVPGNPVAKQLEALTEGYDQALNEAQYAVEDAQEDYAEILAAADIAVADELAGVTTADRFDAILDGIAKRLDESYDSASVEEGKRQRVEQLKLKLQEGLSNVKRAEALRAEIESQGEAQLKAVRGEYAKNQTSTVKSFSQMPLFGAVVLKTAEAYDGRRDFRVGGVMAWSPKLQDEAAQLLLGGGKGEPRPNKKSFDEWIRSLDLSKMVGTRRYLASDGSVNFVGFAATEYDPNNVGREAEKRAFVSQQARGMAVLSMKSDVEVSRLAETQTFGVDTEEGREDFTFTNWSENMVQSTNGAVSIQGMVSPSPRRMVHKPSGKRVFVAYAYINSDVAAASSEFREQAYEVAKVINIDQSRRRGREAGMRAAVEASKNDPTAYREGYAEGRSAVESKPKDRGETQPKAPKAPVATSANAGVFDDGADADDDF